MDITYSFMIPALEWIARQFHSYGWAIVILTVAVRIIVHPLVAASTRSMQRMSQMQPQIKVIQEKYKGNPELFQKKTMEFYQKNKINPMGGCLPTLVQLPILFALFATFTGPPFGDKAIPVKVKVVAKTAVVQINKAEVSGGNSPYVGKNGARCKLVVFPGDSTIAEGDTIDFGVRAVDGTMPAEFKAQWKVQGAKNVQHGASIDESGHAAFPEPGEVTVNCVVPGIAKNESFCFINSLGKVSQGMALFKPANWDNLVMIFLFGITMFFSQKLMVQPAAPNADPDQLAIQQQTQRTMPIAVTAMFFFIPLPSGVFLYMVISNIIQSLQTWWVMRTPAPALVDVLAEGPAGSQGEIIVLDKSSAKVSPVQNLSSDGPGGGGQVKKAAKKRKKPGKKQSE